VRLIVTAINCERGELSHGELSANRMVHAVNIVLEKIREFYLDINKLINNSNVLSTYLKFKYNCNLFRLF
jgi:hypothetical protein